MPDRPSSSSPHSAIRLTFAYEGTEVELVDRQQVEAIAPPGEPEPMPEGASGTWIELRDKGGASLYRRSVPQPIRLEAEVFPEDHRELPRHVPRLSPRGAFAVLVPDLADADHAALWSSPPNRERAHEAATVLLEVPLRGRRPPRKGSAT